MSKQDQFLWAVQTIMLSNAINLSLNPATAEENRHIFSATGVTGTLRDVLWASDRIPDEMSAIDAANQFCGYMLPNLREANSKVPAWFARS
ncbi:hypothetical protein WM40_17400 [Robbsia andropogonis]|uniref:Uncharacterized protein n=1 Tax=Robbsia andropogonis TaxID=28092 RepID=A0A0F5JXP0_9BURK|nr:hypothetical protein [Robbsia andropogonis]KKB62414.1 hypothetical protein WM40_17400 [Robbsia andropogonis]